MKLKRKHYKEVRETLRAFYSWASFSETGRRNDSFVAVLSRAYSNEGLDKALDKLASMGLYHLRQEVVAVKAQLEDMRRGRLLSDDDALTVNHVICGIVQHRYSGMPHVARYLLARCYPPRGSCQKPLPYIDVARKLSSEMMPAGADNEDCCTWLAGQLELLTDQLHAEVYFCLDRIKHRPSYERPNPVHEVVITELKDLERREHYREEFCAVKPCVMPSESLMARLESVIARCR